MHVMNICVQLGLIGLVGVTAPQVVTVELNLELERVRVDKKVSVPDQRQMNRNAIGNCVKPKWFTGMVTALELLVR